MCAICQTLFGFDEITPQVLSVIRKRHETHVWNEPTQHLYQKIVVHCLKVPGTLKFRGILVFRQMCKHVDGQELPNITKQKEGAQTA
jgi:hypothetical protein